MKITSLSASVDARRKAFTLLEMVIVLVILGLLILVGFPSIQVVKRASDKARIVADFKAMRGAFETYSTQKGEWPHDVAAGSFPPEMEGYIGSHHFTEPTPFGAQWDWDGPDVLNVAAITLVGDSLEDETMQTVDSRLDDGNLATGAFRKGVTASNGYSFVLSE